jgi:hypothetical protein
MALPLSEESRPDERTGPTQWRCRTSQQRQPYRQPTQQSRPLQWWLGPARHRRRMPPVLSLSRVRNCSCWATRRKWCCNRGKRAGLQDPSQRSRWQPPGRRCPTHPPTPHWPPWWIAVRAPAQALSLAMAARRRQLRARSLRFRGTTRPALQVLRSISIAGPTWLVRSLVVRMKLPLERSLPRLVLQRRIRRPAKP